MNDDPPSDDEPDRDSNPSPGKHEALIERVWSQRREMWNAGFRPVPVYGHDQPISDWIGSPGKQPAGKAWHEQAMENPPRAVTERPRHDALNTGVLANGLRPFDLDIEDAAALAAVRSVIEEHLGFAPVRFRRNSPKKTLLYRAAEGEPPKRTLTGEGHSKEFSMKVEVLGRNGQFVAFGTHPSGAQLEWENDKAPGCGVNLDDLPVVTEEQVAFVLDEVAPLIGAQRPSEKKTHHQNPSGSGAGHSTDPDHDQTADIADVAAALSAIPNNSPADWTFWKNVGMATHRATEGSAEGLDAWVQWSAKNPAHNYQACQREWEAMRRSPPTRIGAGTLFKMAQDAVPGWRAPSWDARRSSQDSNGDKSEGVWCPRGFEMTSSGLYFHEPAKADDDGGSEATWVAEPFDVLGMCQNGTGGEWGKVLRWTDKAGNVHEQIVLNRLLPGRSSGDQIAALLENGGLQCSAAPALLKRFLMGVKTDRILRTVETTGWHPVENGGWVYVLADGATFGEDRHDVILRPDLRRFGPETAENGSLDDWKKQVARYGIGNSRLGFFLSAAFAGPLLAIGAEPSGGIHLVGKSRSGKSSALFMAGSVWGRSDAKVRTWRATSNGLEGVAKASSDGCLFLDEIGQADGKDAGDAIYMLANGQGKMRATTTGAARETFSWTLLYLSSGEITLDGKMAEGNRTAATGLQIRLVNLDADVGAGMGVFQNLHDKATPAELADHLRTASRSYHGVAARAYLRELTLLRSENTDDLKAMIEAFREEFNANYVPSDADGQVISVAGRFSLIGAAGELAAALDILPWENGEANKAAGECFTDWLKGRGHAGAGEDEQAIAVVRRFIVANGLSRFSELGATDDIIRDRVGWRKSRSDHGEDYLFHSDVWASVFNGTNISPSRAAHVLDRKGFLLNKEKGRLTARLTVEGSRPRVYWVSGHILSDDGETTA